MSLATKRRNKGFILAICIVSILLISILTSTILFSVTVQNSTLKLEKLLASNRFEIDQLGEMFLAGKISAGTHDMSIYGYDFYCDVKAEGTVLEVSPKSDIKNILLYVEKDSTGKVLVWSNSKPEAAEGGAAE